MAVIIKAHYFRLNSTYYVIPNSRPLIYWSIYKNSYLKAQLPSEASFKAGFDTSENNPRIETKILLKTIPNKYLEGILSVDPVLTDLYFQYIEEVKGEEIMLQQANEIDYDKNTNVELNSLLHRKL